MTENLDYLSREQELIKLNEELDIKRTTIVERAEELLAQQKNFLKTCVNDNISSLEKDIELDEIDNINLDNYEKKDESQIISSDNKEEEMPIARTLVPIQSKQILPTPTTSVCSSIKSKSRPLSSKQISKNKKNIKKQESNNNDPDDNLLGLNNISAKNELKLQKARYSVLNKKYNELIEIKNEKEKEINSLNSKLKNIENEFKKDKKKLHQNEINLKNEKLDNENLIKKNEILQLKITDLTKELKSKENEKKKINNNDKINHLKLNRALENAEKYKRLLEKYKNENNNYVDVQNDQVTQLKNENKILMRQKNELLSAFKKQMKLIDILKKQKIHLETAKVLQFNEQQFIKALEIGEKLMQK